MSKVNDRISQALEQRITKDKIDVQFFEGNTSVCASCQNCYIMPYDYFGILHYLDFIKILGIEVDYLLRVSRKYCEYIQTTQRNNGSWPSLDFNECPDDPLATASNLLILAYYDCKQYDKEIFNAKQAIIRMRDVRGVWTRPLPLEKHQKLMCTRELELLTIHRCVEALNTCGGSEGYDDSAMNYLNNIENDDLIGVGFLNKFGACDISDVSGMCHHLQAILKSDGANDKAEDIVNKLLNIQGGSGEFNYNSNSKNVSLSDTSDITAFVMQSLSLYILTISSNRHE